MHHGNQSCIMETSKEKKVSLARFDAQRRTSSSLCLHLDDGKRKRIVVRQIELQINLYCNHTYLQSGEDAVASGVGGHLCERPPDSRLDLIKSTADLVRGSAIIYTAGQGNRGGFLAVRPISMVRSRPPNIELSSRALTTRLKLFSRPKHAAVRLSNFGRVCEKDYN